jgi:hypothetical protein
MNSYHADFVFSHFPFAAKRRRGVMAALAITVASTVGSETVRAQTDNFDDHNDNGWTRYSPLAPFGVPGVFSFPNGGYRIQTTVPTGSKDNPGRAGTLRADVTYSDFYVAVDLVDWKDDTRQAFGLLARVGTPGLGTTTGYAFTYERGSGVSETSGDLDISRLDGEAPAGLQTGPSGIHLDPNKDYRFVFIGQGPTLEGRIYELPNVTTPLITISGSDSTYESGFCGMVIYDNSGGNGVTDATFDNYLADKEEPPLLSTLLDPSFQEIEVSWPVKMATYILESTPVLPATTWTEESNVVQLGDRNFHRTDASRGNKFFRLRKSAP